MEKTGMRLGAQLYTVREYMKTREDFKNTMRKTAAIGYGCVQVSGAADAPAETVKEMRDETGMDVIITHSPADRILHDT
ncbi:MAG: sugar phosphate isomerase/epimerase, partial [Clostridia bacterium]|nr:sugar phosphate isomerase/epimerase [Clostridia bacterium]